MRKILLLCLLLVSCAPVAQADRHREGRVMLTPAPYATPNPQAAPMTRQQATANITTQWQGSTLYVTWHATGYHCLWLDVQPIDCRNDSVDLLLKTGGVDTKYAPRPGQTLRLIDTSGNVPAQAVVPARVYRVIVLPVLR